MPLRIRSVTIRERDELEPILIANPGVIEDGLRVISHQQQTNTGPLDILGVDQEGTLVVIELKNEAAEGHIDQGLRYYDWCRQNLAWIGQAFKSFGIDVNSVPRLFLIAPSFTDTVRQIAKYVAVGVDLKLFEYQAVENEKGERGLICKELDYGEPLEPPRIMSLADKAKRFEDAKVRKLWESILAELPKKGIEVKPVSGHSVTFWHKGRRFMWMAPRRRWFSAKVLSPAGGWAGLENITTRKGWDRLFNTKIKKYLDYLNASTE